LRRAAVVLVLTACASFEAAAPTVVEAGAADDAGSSDAGSGDGSSSNDADPSVPFCATFVPTSGETLFCRDFDDGRPAIEGWNDTSVTSGSSLALDPTVFVSAPLALLARIEADAGDGCAYARGVRDVGSLRIQTRVAFDVRLSGDSTYFTFDTGTCGMIFTGGAQRGGVHLQMGATEAHYPMLDSFPRPGTWTHVEMELRSGTNQLDVTVDGKAALTNGTATLPTGCLTATSKISVRIGMHCEARSASLREVRIDNVVVTGTKL
jgi:hypothetical protein